MQMYELISGVKATAAGTMLTVALGVGAGCQITIDPGELETLELQPTERFAAGATFYLPQPAQGRWVLASGPEGNANVVVTGADGYARFTPVVAGDYEFVIEGSSERRTLGVVDQVPFEHYNYYPNSSIAEVQGELWVAHVFDPQVTRIDPGTGEILGTLRTGPWPVALGWREGMDVAVVAHKAGDTLGFIDLGTGSLVDAVWVGDEPADLVISPDGTLAYASLTTQGAVAVVDLIAREHIATIPTNSNPSALALSEDGSELLVASYRSAQGERLDGTGDERADLYDIAVVDTESLEVVDYIESVGSNINALRVDGDRLYVATTRIAPDELTIDANNTAFRHTVARYDLAARSEVVAADLGRQDSSVGFAVRPFGMARLGDRLWVAVEGSDLVVGLDPDTLAEVARFEVTGRPRSLLAHGDQLYVHGAQSYQVHVADAAGSVAETITLAGDPRPVGVVAGQYLYTGHGAVGGDNHGCGECHVDALTDGNLWNAGVFTYLAASRPMFWLEGTHPIGWEADGADLYSYLFGSPAPTIGLTIDTEAHAAFYDYLAALVPPPAANGLTERDGSMTEAARRGEAIFGDEARCTSCHVGSLSTNRVLLPVGTLPNPTDVPSLVGAYRHEFWLADGSARTLDEATTAMLPLSGVTLSDEQQADLVRYLQELTARDFFLLGSLPEAGAASVASSEAIELTFSHAIFDDPANLERISLRDASDAIVPATITAEHRGVLVEPGAPLAHGQTYEIVIDAGFEAFDERAIPEPTRVAFTVAEAPALSLDGEYTMTILRPGLDFENERYDYEVVLEIETPVVAEATDYGARVRAQLSDIIVADYEVVVEGTVSRWPALIMATSPTLLGKTFPTDAELVDEDGDGVADSASGILFFRSPGLEARDVPWTLARRSGGGDDCGSFEGTHPLDLSFDPAGRPIVDWSADVDALGYYVTDVDAAPPVGPGVVTGGASYWVVQSTSFPEGFGAPVEYGVVPEGGADLSEDNGAPLGGAELPTSGCIKLTVQFTDFSASIVTYEP